MKEFAITVSIHLKPGKEVEFLALLMPVIDAVRLESTFINNFLHQDPEDPTRFMVYENWADRDEFFDVQFEPHYRQTYESRLPALLAEPRQIEIWRPLRTDFAGQRVPEASYTMPFAFSPDRVWQAIRSFRDYEWGEGVGPGVIEGDGPDNEVGSVRAFTYYGVPSRQRLTAHSDADRTYSYASCEPFDSIQRYELTVKVEPLGEQASKVAWTARYEAPEAETPKWNAYLAEEFRKSLVKLRDRLEAGLR
jgi:quinol monooxygenase YgiN